MWVHLIEFFGEFLPIPRAEQIYLFSYRHLLLATVFAFILGSLVFLVLLSSILELRHSLPRAVTTRSRILSCVAGLLGLGMAFYAVLRVQTFLEPVPIFEEGQRDFVREPVVLRWKQNPLIKEV